MKFSTREDIEAPIDHVFACVTNFAAFERRALRQGAQVQRVDQGDVTLGSAWDVSFIFRGTERQMHLKVTDFDAPQTMQIDSTSSGLSVALNIDLVALSRKRTRLAVSVDLRAKTLTARVLLQSMKLGKARLTRRFKLRVQDFAEDLEEAYRKNA